MALGTRLHTILKHVASGGVGMSVAGLGLMAQSSHTWEQGWYALCHAGRGLNAVGQAGFNVFESGNTLAGGYLMGLLLVVSYRLRKVARIENSPAVCHANPCLKECLL
jgi:hypothetical protein